jgi:hypothetical protein
VHTYAYYYSYHCALSRAISIVGREYIKVCEFLQIIVPYGISLRDSTISFGRKKVSKILPAYGRL